MVGGATAPRRRAETSGERLACVVTEPAPKRRAAWAIMILGALITFAAIDLAPRPVDLEQWAAAPDDPPRAVAARGPAIARYDAASDTTIAAFPCGHGYCASALILAGDARAFLGDTRIYIVLTERAGGVEPLDPPLASDRTPEPIASAFRARFEARLFWLALPALPAGALALATGAARLVRRETGERLLRGALVGGPIGAWAATLGGDAIVFGYLYVVLASALACVVMSVGAWKKARWTAGAFALATVAMFLYARSWFPSAPSL